MPRAGSDELEIEGWEGSLKGWSEWEECRHEMRESQGQSLWNPSINPPQKRPLKGWHRAGQRIKRQDSRTRNGQGGRQTNKQNIS